MLSEARIRGWVSDLKESVRPYYLRWVLFRLLPGARPDYFATCWDYPWQPLSSGTLLQGGGSEPDFLFLPMVDWHARIQRSQHLARELARRGHRCIWLNPHLGRQFPHTRLREKDHRVALLEPGIVELHVRLPREPVFHERHLRELENATLLAALQSLIRASGVRRLVQVLSVPTWGAVARALRESSGAPILYDCHDLLSGFRGLAREIVEREPELFRVADLVMFSSQHLMDTKVSEFPWLREKSLLLRNAVDFSCFADTFPNRSDAGDSVKRIGYCGSLTHWFDTRAVFEAARRWSDWEFVLIGRIEDRRVLALRKLSNVRLLGEVPYSELPKEVARFDVGLIPFQRCDLTLSTNPIKLYEYFSRGLPVVGTRLPELELFGDLVYLADDPESFAEQVGRAAQETAGSLRQRRKAVACRESWESRVDQLLMAFGKISSSLR